MEDDAAMLLAADIRTTMIDRRWLGVGQNRGAGSRTASRLAPEQLCVWLAMAAPGDSTVYYRGHLGRDRCRSTTGLSEPDRLRLIALARQALIAAEDGRVHLIQRRHSDGDYSYIAVLARWSAAQSSRANAPDRNGGAAHHDREQQALLSGRSRE
jgi:hypothetical protein